MDESERMPHEEDELAERGRRLIGGAVAQTRAPQGLRERIEADREAAASRRRGRRRPLAWVAGAVAAGIAAAVLVLGGGGAAGPSVFAVAEAGAAAPTGGPPPAGRHHGYLAVHLGEAQFPDWREERWPATGQRSDRVGGRTVRTVTYEAPDGTPAWYSIVDGAPLEVPARVRERRVAGKTYHVLMAAGHRVVTWRNHGQTCVLSAPRRVPEWRLVELAAWEPA